MWWICNKCGCPKQAHPLGSNLTKTMVSTQRGLVPFLCPKCKPADGQQTKRVVVTRQIRIERVKAFFKREA